MYVYSEDINYPSWREQIGSNHSANPKDMRLVKIILSMGVVGFVFKLLIERPHLAKPFSEHAFRSKCNHSVSLSIHCYKSSIKDVKHGPAVFY